MVGVAWDGTRVNSQVIRKRSSYGETLVTFVTHEWPIDPVLPGVNSQLLQNQPRNACQTTTEKKLGQKQSAAKGTFIEAQNLVHQQTKSTAAPDELGVDFRFAALLAA